MKRHLLQLGLALLVLPTCGRDDADGQLFPRTASSEGIQQLYTAEAERLRDTPLADQVRSYGMYLQREDGEYAPEQGAVIVLPQEDESFLVAYYMPEDDGSFARIGDPVRITGTRVPHVGNPRDSATCLRAKQLDGSGEWYGCVERGRVVTGTE